jgi:uncharacterized integral membrane protein
MGSTTTAATWEADWLWSLPLIVLSVVIHVVGLMLIFREVIRIMSIAVVRRRFASIHRHGHGGLTGDLTAWA